MASKKTSAGGTSAAVKKPTNAGQGPAKPRSRSGTNQNKAGTSKRPTAAELAQKEREHRNQMWAIVLFAVGILVSILAFIEGSSGWKIGHDVLRGIFGPISFAVGPLIIYLAVIVTLGKENISAGGKVWQTLFLLVMLCGISQLFFGLPEGDGFLVKLFSFYTKGVILESGGLLAAFISWPLMQFLGGVLGAAVIQILLVFVFLMLVSGSTLIGLFRSFARPVKQISNSYQEHRERRELVEEERSRQTAIDIPMEGDSTRMPEHPVFSPNQNFDKALENFSTDTKEIRRRKKEQESLLKLNRQQKGLLIDPETGEVLDASPEAPASTAEKPVNPDSLWSAPMPRSAIDSIGSSGTPDPAALSGETTDNASMGEPFPFEPDEDNAAKPSSASSEDGHVDLNAFDEILGSVLDGAEQSSDAFGSAPTVGEAGGDTPSLDRRLDRAIGELGKMPAASASAEKPKAPEIKIGQPTPLEEEYRYPPVSLLKLPKNEGNVDVSEELKANAAKLVETLKSFGVQTRVIAYSRGPTVTRYELQPLAGVKISKITGLSDDIALNLATAGVRIEAPIPNKPAVGIEVPNRKTDSVAIRELIDSEEFRSAKSPLSIVLGKDIAGNVAVGDIASMPHLLIAGTTGSGKSVCVNSMIISILYKSPPRDVRFIMIDPKVVEMGIYNGIPHLLIPVVTDPKKAAGALNWAVAEMLKRYAAFAEHSVRDIKGYNKLAESSEELQHMPHVVILIDELADLMMAAPNEVEDAICRLAQMARAAGMHLIIATQRPSVDVVTGLIKANVPSRIALSVSSQVDSRTILDCGGAEKLLGKGDMLYCPMGFPKPVRVQGCYVSDGEIEQVVEFLKSGGEPVVYDADIMDEIERQAVTEGKKKGASSSSEEDGASDELFEDAVQCVLDAGQCSTSYLQRRLKVGYARAARLVDELESRGLVGPPDGSKPREIRITKNQWAEYKLNQRN